MKNLIVKLTAAALAANMASVASADVYADYVTGISPNVIDVTNDGSTYTKLKTSFQNVIIDTHISYDTLVGGKIKSWSSKPSFHGSWYMGDFNWSEIGNTFPKNDRPTAFATNKQMKISRSKMKDAAIKACTKNAEVLKSKGKSDAEIYGKAHILKYNVELNTVYDVTGAGNNNPEEIVEYGATDNDFTVRCIASPKVRFNTDAIGGIQSQVKVTEASISLKGISTPGGECKARIRLHANTSIPNMNMKFRYIHSSGAKSKVYNRKSNANSVLVYTEEFDVPVDQNGWAEGMFHVESAGGAPFKTLPALYKFKCIKSQVGGFSSNTGGTPTHKLK